MGRTMRLNVELPAAEIDCGLSCNRAIRQDGCAPLGAQKIAHACPVKFTALGDGLRERSMTNEFRVVARECRAAENVVGMDVSDDHMADRQIGSAADCLAKREPVGQASPGSMTATDSLPTTKPMLAMASLLAAVAISVTPTRTNRPGATSTSACAALNAGRDRLAPVSAPRASAAASLRLNTRMRSPSLIDKRSYGAA